MALSVGARRCSTPRPRSSRVIEGERFLVISIGGGLSVRAADGTWTAWPMSFPGGLVSDFVRRLPGDRWLLAADAGLAAVWVDDRWCQILTGVARTFLSAGLSSNGQSAWLSSYSDSPDEPARSANIRVESPPPAQSR